MQFIISEPSQRWLMTRAWMQRDRREPVSWSLSATNEIKFCISFLRLACPHAASWLISSSKMNSRSSRTKEDAACLWSWLFSFMQRRFSVVKNFLAVINLSSSIVPPGSYSLAFNTSITDEVLLKPTSHSRNWNYSRRTSLEISRAEESAWNIRMNRQCLEIDLIMKKLFDERWAAANSEKKSGERRRKVSLRWTTASTMWGKWIRKAFLVLVVALDWQTFHPVWLLLLALRGRWRQRRATIVNRIKTRSAFVSIFLVLFLTDWH